MTPCCTFETVFVSNIKVRVFISFQKLCVNKSGIVYFSKSTVQEFLGDGCLLIYVRLEVRCFLEELLGLGRAGIRHQNRSRQDSSSEWPLASVRRDAVTLLSVYL